MKNIKLLCKEKRCFHITKEGTVCKRKCKLLNNGYCYQHNKIELKDIHYKLMEKFMYLVLCQQGKFITKLRMIDLGKKLILRFDINDLSLDEILEKFYRYFSVNNLNAIDSWDTLYSYYKLKKPCEKWIKYCDKNHCIV
tara:strand:- start:659 stop:1075 length:417 start_codon:yes stop_codon:yes gene_type:complete